MIYLLLCWDDSWHSTPLILLASPMLYFKCQLHSADNVTWRLNVKQTVLWLHSKCLVLSNHWHIQPNCKYLSAVVTLTADRVQTSSTHYKIPLDIWKWMCTLENFIKCIFLMFITCRTFIFFSPSCTTN